MLLARYRHGTLDASGEAVGLPAGQMGNSEVGHTNLGAGRVVYQDLTRIDKSIRDGELAGRPALLAALDRCSGDAHAVHFIGLLSDGGVHSHEAHLHALLEVAKQRGVSRVFVHAITDGRDTSPTGGARLRRDARSRAREDGRRPDCHGLRPLLRDGSRQALGAHHARLRRDRPWRRAVGRLAPRR